MLGALLCYLAYHVAVCFRVAGSEASTCTGSGSDSRLVVKPPFRYRGSPAPWSASLSAYQRGCSRQTPERFAPARRIGSHCVCLE